MGSPADDPMPPFVRRSDTESVCTASFKTLRIQPGQPLEIEENIHKIHCPASIENLHFY
jgi:hypothetical protein